MFFIGVFGIDAKIDPIEGKVAARCPACEASVQLSVCKKYNYFHAFFIPVVKYRKEYICTCPHCASALLMDEALGIRLEQVGHCEAAPSQLTLIKNNRLGLCSKCGCRNNPGARFCQSCGETL